MSLSLQDLVRFKNGGFVAVARKLFSIGYQQ